MSYLDYGLTPAQYHAGLDKLWEALGVEEVQDKDIFTLCAEEIKRLKAKNEKLEELLDSQKWELMEAQMGPDF